MISMSSNYGRINNNGNNDTYTMMFTVQTIIILKVRWCTKDKDPFTISGIGNSDTVAILPIRTEKGRLTASWVAYQELSN